MQREVKSKMKVLFVPCVCGVLPHLGPLVALAAQLAGTRYEPAFLLPAQLHQAARMVDLPVVDINYQRDQGFRNEMLAYGKFKPDVVVDDLGVTSLLSTKLAQLPRVAIQRTGVFRGAVPNVSTHRHSFGNIDFAKFYQHAAIVCNAPSPQNLIEACEADAKIVPGIRSIEVLPPGLSEDPSFFFAGPLIIRDELTEAFVRCTKPTEPTMVDKLLREFFHHNQGRRIVFLTLGTNLSLDVNYHSIHTSIRNIIEYMLGSGNAVIASLATVKVSSHVQDMFFNHPFLPMHLICSRVDLMVHHCGSGTYQYQIVHAVPSVCIGSQCYDRDDVALRLDELAVAKYIPSPSEVPEFETRFMEAFDSLIDPTSVAFSNAKCALGLLKAECDRTSAAFNFETVLKYAIDRRQ
jgi:hypothetical protein